jgi:hypothetical protein
LISRNVGKTEPENIREQSADENIGSKKDNVAGIWRKLRNEELHKFYVSPSILIIVTRRMR